MVDPARGEIWDVDLDPADEGELDKTRPVVVLSADAFRRLDSRVVVPFTEWQPRFENQQNKVEARASSRNGLDYDSAADVAQVRAVALRRFHSRRGRLEAAVMEEVVAGVAIVIDF